MSGDNREESPGIEDCLGITGSSETKTVKSEADAKRFADLAVRRVVNPEKRFAESYREAGYPVTKDQNQMSLVKKEVNALINPLAEKLGITVEQIGRGWRKLLRGKREVPLVVGNDVRVIEIPDNTTRLKSHVEVSKILGLYPETQIKMTKKLELGIEPETMEALAALKNREKQLEAEVEIVDDEITI